MFLSSESPQSRSLPPPLNFGQPLCTHATSRDLTVRWIFRGHIVDPSKLTSRVRKSFKRWSLQLNIGLYCFKVYEGFSALLRYGISLT